jgi:hypothetical protein
MTGKGTAAAGRRAVVEENRRAVERRYAASTDRLVSALQTAAALREHADGQAQRRLAELAGREQALRSVLARLDPAD